MASLERNIMEYERFREHFGRSFTEYERRIKGY